MKLEEINLEEQISLEDQFGIQLQIKEQSYLYRDIKITNSKEAENIFRQIIGDLLHVEKFAVIYLNRANRIVGHSLISIGGISGTVADRRVIMQQALLCNASAVIICHNHPSGNPSASHTDIKLTKIIKESGDIMDIKLLDHLILTSTECTSLNNEGDI